MPSKTNPFTKSLPKFLAILITPTQPLVDRITPVKAFGKQISLQEMFGKHFTSRVKLGKMETLKKNRPHSLVSNMIIVIDLSLKPIILIKIRCLILIFN